AETIFKERRKRVEFKYGTMIEIRRACIIADQIATKTEFFSFGTNDLTQTVLGISRDDAQKSFLTRYVEEKIIPADPFQVLDREGVGAMMRMAVERGRKTNPNLKIGICGEHAGEASSVALCHELGLTYVSPSTYRVPVARLAAARAILARDPARARRLAVGGAIVLASWVVAIGYGGFELATRLVAVFGIAAAAVSLVGATRHGAALGVGALLVASAPLIYVL